MHQCYIGVDIGGTNVRVVFAQKSQLLLKISQSTIKSGSEESLANQVIGLIKSGLDQLEIPIELVGGIGISSAGPFVNGTHIFCPNISGPKQGNSWGAVPFINLLKKAFSQSIVIEMENDCVSSVKAEHLFGVGRGYSHLVYVTISTGVGTGMIIDGHLCQGKGHNAGHFGHIVLQKDGPLCGCGNRGCVESLISGKSIVREAIECGLNPPKNSKITTKYVFDCYRKHNPIAEHVIRETIEYLGIFFSNIINVTDCELIIIGGSVFYHNYDVLLDPVIKYLDKHSYPALRRGVEFKLVGLGEYVGDVAGLSLVIPPEWISKWQESKPWEKGFKEKISL